MGVDTLAQEAQRLCGDLVRRPEQLPQPLPPPFLAQRAQQYPAAQDISIPLMQALTLLLIKPKDALSPLWMPHVALTVTMQFRHIHAYAEDETVQFAAASTAP